MGGTLAGARGDAGAFATVERPRVLERLAVLESFPISLVVAPAGYGKSVILRQYLATLKVPCVRFSVRAEHATLLGFLRGFAQALGPRAPHALDTLSGAYERTSSVPQRIDDLAQWMHAHLEQFAGVVAIDDLHVGESTPEIARFLTALVERTKGRIRWIIAARTIGDLPLGTWLAYGDADAPVDESELRFTLLELEEAARSLNVAMSREELQDLLSLTEGWPAAVVFALRTSTRSSDLRRVSALTREMIYRLLAEQVYADLTEEERDLLDVAIALPAIDIAVLENAGFDRALQIVERLSKRTTFIYEDGTGTYQCHDLFRDFLKRQSALDGANSQQSANRRAARALEEAGDVEHALGAYLAARSASDTARILQVHGFDLLERAHADIVSRALDSINDLSRRQNARILAIHGALAAMAGKFSRAETLFRRSLARADNDPELVAEVTLRLASIIANQGRDISAVVKVVCDDPRYTSSHRAEAFAMLAAMEATRGRVGDAKRALTSAHGLVAKATSDAAVARTFHYIGIASRHAGDPAAARHALISSSEISKELHMYSLASRTCAVLSNLALQEDDDIKKELEYAEEAVQAAAKAGDIFALQTGLIQVLAAYLRRGDRVGCETAERRLLRVRDDELSGRYIALFRSIRLSWQGRFGEAHRLLRKGPLNLQAVDKSRMSAYLALFLALDGKKNDSDRNIADAAAEGSGLKSSGVFGRRSQVVTLVLCALAELANGRWALAGRMLRRIEAQDYVEETVRDAALRIASDLTSLPDPCLEMLVNAGYGEVAWLLQAVASKLVARKPSFNDKVALTASEQNVLQLLNDGLAPKEIADETNRSINTVRVHIAHAVQKLSGRSRLQAIQAALELGLIQNRPRSREGPKATLER